LIPYPHAAEDHQTRNAEIFAQCGASRLLPEATLNDQILAHEVESILLRPDTAATMRAAAQKAATPDAARIIADVLIGK
jgi:UDP-N-acetylglucosamine--N-acetylmuramyl-(pentapeptide) pyrophosphoryl-undecaprenol N-acetylglucosamine transferase